MTSTTRTLRHYQTDLIDRVAAAARAGHRRILMQAPVGSGKSVVVAEIVRRAACKQRRVLLLAHRRRLVAQLAGHLRAANVDYGIHMQGVQRRTCAVQVASRDTLLSRSVRNEWVELPAADLVIVDECHRASSDDYMKLLQRYPASTVIGVTATPALENGRSLADYWTHLECCAGIGQLISEGHIVPVRCYAPQNRTSGRRKLAGDPVASWQAHGEGRPTVLFASRVEDSKSARDAFLLAGITAEHLDAHTDDAERDAIMARVESGETKIVCSVGVMTEGWDSPCLSCAVILRMAGSYVLFIQMIGRIMRSYPGKSDAVVIDHSDCVLEHGFPDEPVDWQLGTDTTVDARNTKDRKEGKRSQPVTCPKCGFLYSPTAATGVVCPECGHRLPKRLQPRALRNQLLTEVERLLSPEERRERQVRFWHECLRVMAHKGMTFGAAAGMYRGRYKDGPDESLPNFPQPWQWRQKVADALPQYLGGSKH